MKQVLPFVLFFAAVFGLFYFNRYTRGQKKWIKTVIGIVLIGLWIYALMRFV